MSPAAARRLCRPLRHICLGCRRHPARFRYRGEVRADRDHTLCFRCYRAERNRQRAREFFRSEVFRLTTSANLSAEALAKAEATVVKKVEATVVKKAEATSLEGVHGA